MRRSWLVVASLLGFGMTNALTAASICTSIAANAVLNCGFETGDFTDWTISGNLEGPAPGPLSPPPAGYSGFGNQFYGVDNADPNSGSYEAYLNVGSQHRQTGVGDNYGPVFALAQTITVIPDEYYSVAFDLKSNGSPDPAHGYDNYFDAFFNGAQLFSASDTADSGGVYVPFTLKAATGNQTTAVLQFDSTNDAGQWLLDDVSVTPLGPVPEPGTILLIMPAVAGLMLLLRLRQAARAAR